MPITYFRDFLPGRAALASVAVSFALVSCGGNNPCPDKTRIEPQSSCKNEQLQCPYEVTFKDCSDAGVSVTSSCVCTGGRWECPSETPICPVASSSDGAAPPSGPSFTVTLDSGTTVTRPINDEGGSCPLLFVWNGSAFQYETDVNGMIFGLPAGANANHDIPVQDGTLGYTKMPDAAYDASAGLDIRFRESVREISFLDEARLLLVDAPAGYEVWSSGEESTNEWGYMNPFTLYTTFNPRVPTSAVDRNGNDVLAEVSDADNVPAPMQGEADALDDYTFEFGPLVKPNAKLLIDGWSIYSVRASRNIQPYLEIEDALGNVLFTRKFGAPFGDFKTVVIDLPNLPDGARRFHVHMGIEDGARWLLDRIRLDDSDPVAVQQTWLDVERATLLHRGRATLHRCTFESRTEALDDENADDPREYGYGAFTRYGDVRDLLTRTDDKYVILRHGDQVSMHFSGFSAPAQGLTRTVLLKTDTMIKIFDQPDRYTEPWPFHGMSNFPYPATESYPTDADHTAFITQYNTRVYAP